MSLSVDASLTYPGYRMGLSTLNVALWYRRYLEYCFDNARFVCLPRVCYNEAPVELASTLVEHICESRMVAT